MITARDVMIKDVISISADASLPQVAELLIRHHFNGLPVVDESNHILGFVSEYDIISHGLKNHLPFFIKLSRSFPVYERDKGLIEGDLEKILSLRVKDIMNPKPLIMNQDTKMQEVIKLFNEHHSVNPIPVVDENNILVGIVSRSDIIRLYAPYFRTPLLEKKVTILPEKKTEAFLRNFAQEFILIPQGKIPRWFFISAASLFILFILIFFFTLGT